MIRVIIHRQLIEGAEGLYQDILLHARGGALKSPGYISSESLRDLNNSRHWVLITTWRKASDWDHWFRSEERRTLSKRIRELLLEDESIQVLELH